MPLKPMPGCKSAICQLTKPKNFISKQSTKLQIKNNNLMKPKVHEHQSKTNFSIVSKNIFTIVLCFSFILLLPSCKRKKLTEVVEVPLPSAEEKITIGQPDDVSANDGEFSLTKLPYQYN